jgi:hypothetical protein
MHELGSRTKSTDVWLHGTDVRHLGERLRAVLPAAAWLCSYPGPPVLREIHLHAKLDEAMDCGGVQAFMPLPAGAATTVMARLEAGVVVNENVPCQALIQFLHADVYSDSSGESFRAGRLAVAWNEREVIPVLLPLLEEQTRTVWKVLRSATGSAVIEDASGRRPSGTRIGDAARDLVTSRNLRLTRSGSVPYRLR